MPNDDDGVSFFRSEVISNVSFDGLGSPLDLFLISCLSPYIKHFERMDEIKRNIPQAWTSPIKRMISRSVVALVHMYIILLRASPLSRKMQTSSHSVGRSSLIRIWMRNVRKGVKGFTQSHLELMFILLPNNHSSTPSHVAPVEPREERP